MAKDLDFCDDAGCQGVPVIRRVTFHIFKYLEPTVSGDFVGWWLVFKYPSFRNPQKCWGISCFSGGGWYRALHFLFQGSDHPELIVPNRKGRRKGWVFYHLSQILDCAAGSFDGGKTCDREVLL